jgi:nitrogen fixation protein NifU and related proteins
MSDALYHQAIMARVKSPSRAGRLTAPAGTATIDNPLCGDRVTFDVTISNGRVADIAQHVRGCALCQASASVIAAAAVGQDEAGLEGAERALRALLNDDAPTPAAPWQELSLFAPVRPHRSRHDCVLLPFTALKAAIAAAPR